MSRTKELKEHSDRKKDNVYTDKFSVLDDICTCMF